MIEIRRVSSLDQVEECAWDSMVGSGGFYSSHSWLRSQERSVAATVTYVLVEDDGVLISAAPVYFFKKNFEPEPLGVSDLTRPLRVGPRTGYHNQILVRAKESAADRTQIALLVDGLAQLAAERGLDALLFDYLTDADLASLRGWYDTRVQLRDTEGVIYNDLGTFESYVRSLSPNTKREWTRFSDAGFRVEVTRLSKCAEEMVPLIASTGEKYNARLPDEVIRSYLGEQVRCVDDASVVFRCLNPDGMAVGCSICFVWQDTLYARVAGFDYPNLRNVFEYFNTVYYAPVRYMEKHGLRKLHLGIGSLDAKVRRGATLHSLWACLVPLPVRPSPSPPHKTGPLPCSLMATVGDHR